MNRRSRGFLIMSAASTLVASLLGGARYQPLCSMAWERRRRQGILGSVCRAIIRGMDLVETDHCYIAHNNYQRIKFHYDKMHTRTS